MNERCSVGPNHTTFHWIRARVLYIHLCTYRRASASTTTMTSSPTPPITPRTRAMRMPKYSRSLQPPADVPASF